MQNLLAEIDITVTEAKTLTIKDLNGNPLQDENGEGLTIDLYGIDNKAFRDAVREYSEGDEFRSEKIMAACTASWSGFKRDDMQPMECNFENALGLYKRYPVILGQADSFISSRAAYLKK